MLYSAMLKAAFRAFYGRPPEATRDDQGVGLVLVADGVGGLSPALSPGYELSRAVRAVRREMVVFWSPLDLIVLGLGTRIFGTIDRVNSVSAGLVGFRPPGGGDYAKLRQVRWHPEMAPTGYL